MAGLVASAEVSPSTFGDGNPTVSITEVGAPANGPPNEVNVDVFVGIFPFRGGWTGAHVEADGVLDVGSGVQDQQVTRTGPGRYAVDLGVDIARDGMLLAGGRQDGDHVVTTSLDPGRGWRLRTMSNRMNAPGDKSAKFSFVYLPWDTAGLIAVCGPEVNNSTPTITIIQQIVLTFA